MNIELISFYITLLMFLIFIASVSIFVYFIVKTEPKIDKKSTNYNSYRKYCADKGVITNIEKILTSNKHIDISSSLVYLNNHLDFLKKHNIKFYNKDPDFILKTMIKYSTNKIMSIYGFDEVKKIEKKAQDLIRDTLVAKHYYNIQLQKREKEQNNV